MERRNFFSVLLGAVSAFLLYARGAHARGELLGTTEGGEHEHQRPTLATVVPTGMMFREHRVMAVSAISQGAQSVTVMGPSGEFTIEVCLRDTSAEALAAPAHSKQLDLYLPNGGTGSNATIEAHGLVAMALAAHLTKVEHELDLQGLTTLRERIRAHGPWLISQ
ncbi:MAG: hypothetical protein U0165_14985 [Polyangiaceae bacterium]